MREWWNGMKGRWNIVIVHCEPIIICPVSSCPSLAHLPLFSFVTPVSRVLLSLHPLDITYHRCPKLKIPAVLP